MSSQQTPDQVHWLTGQFCEYGKELMYRKSITSRVQFETCISLTVAALVFGMFAISDYSLLGPTQEYYLLIAMRSVVVVLCFLLVVIIRHWGGYSRRVWLHALPLWILATGIILIVPLRPDSLSTQITSLMVATMAFYLLIPNLLTVVTFASLYLSIGFLTAAVLFSDITTAQTLRTALLFIMANAVGYFALLRLESLQRRQFALLSEERDQNHQLHEEVAHRKSLEVQLRMVAERDALTGLNNRGHFMQLATALLQRSKQENVPFSLFMIDVDHFKRINDTWGHSHGDWVLTKIAEACAQSLRRTDVIGRFGGEEFVVALPDTSPDDAKILAERLKERVAALPSQEDIGTLTPSVTIGIAVAHQEDVDLESLITKADQMLYVGKRDGRNRIVMF
ncbi:MAG: GGDEF domain-containing protein [Pseudomonadota bacterium]